MRSKRTPILLGHESGREGEQNAILQMIFAAAFFVRFHPPCKVPALAEARRQTPDRR